MQLSTALLNGSVLIVGDDIEALEEMADALQDYGLAIHTASNEGMALKLANEHHPEFIIMDYLLRGYTGIDAANAIHKFLPGTQVIMITGHAGTKEAIKALQLKAIDFIIKPISPDPLLDDCCADVGTPLGHFGWDCYWFLQLRSVLSS